MADEALTALLQRALDRYEAASAKADHLLVEEGFLTLKHNVARLERLDAANDLARRVRQVLDRCVLEAL